jgi:hypothetical protein
MGEAGPAWADAAIATLKQGAKTCGVADRLEQEVRFHAISYGEVFDELLADWDRTAEGLETKAQAAGSALGDVIQFLRGTGDPVRSFFWSHAIDVALYRFFPQVSRQVRARVLEQLVTVLEEAMRGGRINASVLAHGLGTAVAHDALAQLGSRPLGGSHAFMVGNFRFDTLFMLCNVSCALQTDFDPYKSVVHPMSVDPTTAYTGLYFNFKHKFDPLPMLRAFSPPDWGRFYRPVEGLEHVLDFDIHSLGHYLRNPRVYVPILNRLLDDAVDEATTQAALEAFAKEKGPPCIVTMKVYAGRLKDLGGLLETKLDPQALVRSSAELFAMAAEVKNECG